MTQAKNYVIESALEWSRTDPYRLFYIMGKKRHQWKIAPSVDQRDWLLHNGYEVLYVINGGKILVDNTKQ